MYEPLDGKFYQATKYGGCDKNNKVLPNRHFTTLKNF